MLKIVSTIERPMPAATHARRTTSRTRRAGARPRSYQTRCGMWCTSGWAPVAIDDSADGRQRGEGRERARGSVPLRRRGTRAPASGRRSTASSKTDGVRPSITIRTSFCSSVLGEDAQPGVALGRRGAREPQREQRARRPPRGTRDPGRGRAPRATSTARARRSAATPRRVAAAAQRAGDERHATRPRRAGRRRAAARPPRPSRRRAGPAPIPAATPSTAASPADYAAGRPRGSRAPSAIAEPSVTPIPYQPPTGRSSTRAGADPDGQCSPVTR